MGTTTKYSLRYPDLATAADVPAVVQNLANDADAAFAGWSTAVFGSRPAAGKAGRIFLASDTGVAYIDDGTAWHALNAIATGSITSAMILDGTITTTDLAFDVATQAELDAAAVAAQVVVHTASAGISAGNNAHVTGAGPTFTLPAGSYIIELYMDGAGISGTCIVDHSGPSLTFPNAYTKKTVNTFGGSTTIASAFDMTGGGAGGSITATLIAMRYNN